MELKFGFIGAGNMASAIINGILQANLTKPQNILVSDVDLGKLTQFAHKGIETTQSNLTVAEECDYIILAVKPNMLEDVLNEITQAISRNTVIISIAAGWTTVKLQHFLPEAAKIVRIMPNTPALIGQAMCVISDDHTLDEDELAMVVKLFSCLGEVAFAHPEQMDAVTAVSGSGPAYVYMFIEALADAGVQQGLPRELAQKLAVQTVLGSAEMVKTTGEHPAVLCDRVCSPGGTTIEGVYALQKGNFYGTIMTAVENCAIKSKSMS